MGHKRGHDRRARDKQEIRATHAADLKDSAERFMADVGADLRWREGAGAGQAAQDAPVLLAVRGGEVGARAGRFCDS